MNDGTKSSESVSAGMVYNQTDGTRGVGIFNVWTTRNGLPVAALRRADGVGEKLAVRIVTELKEKAGKMALGAAAGHKAVAAKSGAGVPLADLPKSAANDAVSALINLGYDRAEAYGAVANILRDRGDDVPLSDLIRGALKELIA